MSADQLAPAPKLSKFFHALLCTSASVTNGSSFSEESSRKLAGVTKQTTSPGFKNNSSETTRSMLTTSVHVSNPDNLSVYSPTFGSATYNPVFCKVDDDVRLYVCRRGALYVLSPKQAEQAAPQHPGSSTFSTPSSSPSAPKHSRRNSSTASSTPPLTPTTDSRHNSTPRSSRTTAFASSRDSIIAPSEATTFASATAAVAAAAAAATAECKSMNLLSGRPLPSSRVSGASCTPSRSLQLHPKLDPPGRVHLIQSDMDVGCTTASDNLQACDLDKLRLPVSDKFRTVPSGEHLAQMPSFDISAPSLYASASSMFALESYSTPLSDDWCPELWQDASEPLPGAIMPHDGATKPSNGIIRRSTGSACIYAGFQSHKSSPGYEGDTVAGGVAAHGRPNPSKGVLHRSAGSACFYTDFQSDKTFQGYQGETMAGSASSLGQMRRSLHVAPQRSLSSARNIAGSAGAQGHSPKRLSFDAAPMRSSTRNHGDPAWLKTPTLCPRLLNGRVGRLLDLQRQGSSPNSGNSSLPYSSSNLSNQTPSRGSLESPNLASTGASAGNGAAKGGMARADTTLH